jgi:NAD(P)-dependent dehydrogenase (short-subunit alcohol dehydrogenase family)
MKYLMTGGSGTFGTAIGLRLSEGGDVTNLARTVAGWAASNVPVDLVVPDAIDELAIDLAAFDGLVLAAGIDSLQGGVEYSARTAELVMRVNATSQLALAAEYCRRRAQADVPAVVVAISSDTLVSDVADAMAYSSSKAALEEGLRVLALDERLGRVAIRSVRAGFVGRSMAVVAEDGGRAERGAVDASVLRGIVESVVSPLRCGAVVRGFEVVA